MSGRLCSLFGRMCRDIPPRAVPFWRDLFAAGWCDDDRAPPCFDHPPMTLRLLQVRPEPTCSTLPTPTSEDCS